MSQRDTSNDFFYLALTLALVTHGALITTVSFRWAPENQAKLPPSLDVVLVQQAPEEAPEHAEYLAQTAQLGGGETDAPELAGSPQPALEMTANDGDAPLERAPSAPLQESPQEQVFTVANSDHQVALSDEPEQVDEPLPQASELIRESLQAARQVPLAYRDQAKRVHGPRRKYVTASTREWRYAAYMQAWVAKVERIGNMNFPEEARRRSLSGNLVLTVAVRQDGSVESVDVLRSSGQAILDQAAVRIVRLAAPFAPLPADIAEQADVLHITRTWEFSLAGLRSG
ncbi:MAG: energy transducer TonB [Wenzhouxiangellaceae bacterium]